MSVDYILNGTGYGEVGQRLEESRFDVGLHRPFFDERGHRCVMVNTGKYKRDDNGNRVPAPQKWKIRDLQDRGVNLPIWNASTFMKDAWIELDRAVVKETRNRLIAWNDLSAAAGRGGFDGMARTSFEYQAMSDPGEAVVDMDGLTDGRTDRPLFKLLSVPLPITHCDFWFSDREIRISRNSSMPLDTTMAEAAARRVAETIEQTLIGTVTGVTAGTNTNEHTGTSTVYGYTNFPYRITKTDLTTPDGTNPEAIVSDVLEMVELAEAAGYYGPYMLYHSTGYSRYLNDDYFRTGSTSAVRTVRERVMEIEGIRGIKRLDYLTSGHQLILVQMTRDVAEAINAMDVTTVMWDSQGGMRHNFKVMAIQVPLLKTTYSADTTNGSTGIVHATTA